MKKTFLYPFVSVLQEDAAETYICLPEWLPLLFFIPKPPESQLLYPADELRPNRRDGDGF